MSTLLAILLMADGGGGGPVSLAAIDGASIENFALAPDTAVSGVRIGFDGLIYQNDNGSETQIGQWLTPATGMSGYEIRNNSGAWLNLGSNRFYNVSASGSGNSASQTFNLQIRPTGGAVVAAASFTCLAEVI